MTGSQQTGIDGDVPVARELHLSEIYHFKSSHWFELAMTHTSYAHEHQIHMDDEGGHTPPEHNERLEFLGDAVLGASLSARLIREFPYDLEGTLSKRRASLVNETQLARIAQRLRLNERIKLGKGEAKTGGALKARILACSLEALLGAIYMDSGYTETDRVIGILFQDPFEIVKKASLEFERDYKTRLQEACHHLYSEAPNYRLVEEFGPAHAREFKMEAMIQGRVIGMGTGRSKKASEQEAAKEGLLYLEKGSSNEQG